MSKIRRRFYGKTKKVQTRLWDAPNKQLCAYGQPALRGTHHHGGG